jgi:hypothetical protein
VPAVAKNTANAHAWGDITQAVWTAALGVAAPIAPLPAAPGSSWYELGWIDDNGLTESQAQQETKHYGWQGGALVRIIRSQSERSFKFQCLEENAVTAGLLRPTATTVTTGATAEVQTITITGTPTGGTFTLTLTGYGTTAALAYNISTAALATALTTLVGATVTVSGTAGTSYVVTFPANLGNVSTMTIVTAFTGGTAPAATIATTTPGVNGVNTISVKPTTSQNLRQFVIDLVDGAVHRRYLIPNGEMIPSADIVYQAKDLTVYEATINCYVDGSGNFLYDINDNPLLATGLSLYA